MMTFSFGAGLMGATAPGQQITPDNIGELPPGSVVRLHDSSRLIHLHDGLWLWCCDHGWCYDRVDRFAFRLKEGATLCHLPAPPTNWADKAIEVIKAKRDEWQLSRIQANTQSRSAAYTQRIIAINELLAALTAARDAEKGRGVDGA